jgi:membrane protein implicated in regulation of membrane protease activity
MDRNSTFKQRQSATALIFFLMTRLFSTPVHGTTERLITPLQRGRVYALGSIWYAQLYDANSQQIFPPGTPVKIVGQQGMTLLVEPYETQE